MTGPGPVENPRHVPRLRRGREGRGAPAGDERPGATQWVLVLNEQAARVSKEIDRRSTSQQALVVVHLTASTALTAAVISGKASLVVLLVLPLVPACLGGQWANHHRTIQGLGYYMRAHLEPALQQVLTGRTPALSGDEHGREFIFWEQFLERTERGTSGSVEARGPRWYRRWRLTVLATFHGVSVLALTLTFAPAVLVPGSAVGGLVARGAEVWLRALWGVALVVTVVSVLSIMRGLTVRWEPDRRDGTLVLPD